MQFSNSFLHKINFLTGFKTLNLQIIKSLWISDKHHKMKDSILSSLPVDTTSLFAYFYFMSCRLHEQAAHAQE